MNLDIAQPTGAHANAHLAESFRTATDPQVETRVPRLPHFRLGVHRHSRRLLALIAASMLVLVGPIAGAAAHDELASSSPAAEATVGVTPTEVVLTFTNPPSGIGAEIIVQDSAGATWSEGPVTVVNNTAVQALKPGTPAGTFTAQWRVVSSDDHPIEGTYTFTSQAAQAGPPAVTPGSSPIATASTAEGTNPSTPSGSDSNPVVTGSSDAADAPTVPAFVIYLGVGGVIVAVILILLTRRRLNHR